MLGYVATSLCYACNFDADNVVPAKNLDSRLTAEYIKQMLSTLRLLKQIPQITLRDLFCQVQMVCSERLLLPNLQKANRKLYMHHMPLHHQ